jgi:hypothetical protein
MVELCMDGLRNRMAVARAKAGVEAAACSGARDEAAACFMVGIEDGRWRWQRDAF